MTDKMWNLTADQWSSVLRTDENPASVAARLPKSGGFVPWSQLLIDESADCRTTADLGSGRGEHSAVLARAGRETTLVDWSNDNLDFSRAMFETLGLKGKFCQADITQPLPLEDRSIDMVFSCGVFEYFNADQIDRIVAEAFRIARKRVIVMVPNAAALGYQLGRKYLEKTGKWEWGGEIPSFTLRSHFKRAGFASIREFSVDALHSVEFLPSIPGGARLARLLTRGLRLTHHHRPAAFRQGYLLVTIGEK